MGRMTYNAGERHMLSAYFQGEPEAFGPFYVGLGSGPAPMVESSDLSDMVEVIGEGYARAQITRDASVTGWTLVGNTVVSPTLTFTNTDLLDSWTAIDYVFLTLAASGTSGTLIAAVDLKDTVYLEPGQSASVVFRFKTTTIVGNESRLVTMAGSVMATSGVSATLTVE